jgi:hypothetical protein
MSELISGTRSQSFSALGEKKPSVEPRLEPEPENVPHPEEFTHWGSLASCFAVRLDPRKNWILM